ncbi:hypothetical protein [Vibrio phage V-YDF132]|nr:hypothetical protein [Vibrio phage V-YDF132]
MFKFNPIKQALFEGFFQRIVSIESGSGLNPMIKREPLVAWNFPVQDMPYTGIGGVVSKISRGYGNAGVPWLTHVSIARDISTYYQGSSHAIQGESTREVIQELPEHGSGDERYSKRTRITDKAFLVVNGRSGMASGGCNKIIDTDLVKTDEIVVDMNAPKYMSVYKDVEMYVFDLGNTRNPLTNYRLIDAKDVGEHKYEYNRLASGSTAYCTVLKLENQPIPDKDAAMWFNQQRLIAMCVPKGTPKSQITISVYTKMWLLNVLPHSTTSWIETNGVIEGNWHTSKTEINSNTYVLHEIYRWAGFYGWERVSQEYEDGAPIIGKPLQDIASRALDGACNSQIASINFPSEGTMFEAELTHPVTNKPMGALYRAGLKDLGGLGDTLRNLAAAGVSSLNQYGDPDYDVVKSFTYSVTPKITVEAPEGFDKGRSMSSHPKRFDRFNSVTGAAVYVQHSTSAQVTPDGNVWQGTPTASMACKGFNIFEGIIRGDGDRMPTPSGDYIYAPSVQENVSVHEWELRLITDPVFGFLGWEIWGRANDSYYDNSSFTHEYDGKLFECRLTNFDILCWWCWSSRDVDTFYTKVAFELEETWGTKEGRPSLFGVRRTKDEWDDFLFGSVKPDDFEDVHYVIHVKSLMTTKDRDVLNPTVPWG